MNKLPYLQNISSKCTNTVFSHGGFCVWLLIKNIIKENDALQITPQRRNTVLNPDLYFSRTAVMNVPPDWLMYISVMNRHKVDHEILMLKVFINYLSKRYEPLPKIE